MSVVLSMRCVHKSVHLTATVSLDAGHKNPPVPGPDRGSRTLIYVAVLAVALLLSRETNHTEHETRRDDGEGQDDGYPHGGTWEGEMEGRDDVKKNRERGSR